jgi:hypothetical protein
MIKPIKVVNELANIVSHVDVDASYVHLQTHPDFLHAYCPEGEEFSRVEWAIGPKGTKYGDGLQFNVDTVLNESNEAHINIGDEEHVFNIIVRRHPPSPFSNDQPSWEIIQDPDSE